VPASPARRRGRRGHQHPVVLGRDDARRLQQGVLVDHHGLGQEGLDQVLRSVGRALSASIS
jgi:hypothetical protein